MKLYDAPSSPNPFTVRLFVAERGGFDLDVETVDLANLENRGLAYRAVNPFGTVPALGLDDGRVISDIVAICEYLDEVATNGDSLVGSTSEERVLVRMWTRRVDQGIAQRFVSWWRGGDDAIDMYRGHRVPETEGRAANRQIAERNLNSLDEHLERSGTPFITGGHPRLADVLLFAFMSTMSPSVPWLLPPGRKNIAAWYAAMEKRPSVKAAREQVSQIVDRSGRSIIASLVGD